MGSSVLLVAIAVGSMGGLISQSEIKKHEDFFQKHWGTEFVWQLDELPEKGTVPKFRVPYSGYIYPDKQGGTKYALRKYDRAFNYGRSLATSHEQWDTTAFKEPVPKNFLIFRRNVMDTPHWYGHCNGWTSAAIRHAEPEQSVVFNGVTFTPADIKALLAEIYIYNDNFNLAGLKTSINAGTFHALIANWLGRGSHPIGMESDPGEEKWNYPIYTYACTSAKRSPNRVEVKMNLAYAKDSNGEYQESPRIRRVKYFHYALTIDNRGKIVGGYFYNDSTAIDLLWVPLRPKPSRAKGNEMGNPHVNVDKVLAIWRASVPAETRQKWPVIDPSPADRILDVTKITSLIPLQVPGTPNPETSVAAATEEEETPDAAAPTADAQQEPSPDATDTVATPEEEATPAADDTAAAADTASPPDATEPAATPEEGAVPAASAAAETAEEAPRSDAEELVETSNDTTTSDAEEMVEIASPGARVSSSRSTVSRGRRGRRRRR